MSLALTIGNEPMYWIERLYLGSLFTGDPFVSQASSTTVKRAHPPRTDYFREIERWQEKVSREVATGVSATVVTIVRPAITAASDPMFWIGRKGGMSWLRAI